MVVDYLNFSDCLLLSAYISVNFYLFSGLHKRFIKYVPFIAFVFYFFL